MVRMPIIFVKDGRTEQPHSSKPSKTFPKADINYRFTIVLVMQTQLLPHSSYLLMEVMRLLLSHKVHKDS